MQGCSAFVICGMDIVSKHQCELCRFHSVGLFLLVLPLVDSADSCSQHQSGGPIFRLDLRISTRGQQCVHQIDIGSRRCEEKGRDSNEARLQGIWRTRVWRKIFRNRRVRIRPVREQCFYQSRHVRRKLMEWSKNNRNRIDARNPTRYCVMQSC